MRGFGLLTLLLMMACDAEGEPDDSATGGDTDPSQEVEDTAPEGGDDGDGAEDADDSDDQVELSGCAANPERWEGIVPSDSPASIVLLGFDDDGDTGTVGGDLDVDDVWGAHPDGVSDVVLLDRDRHVQVQSVDELGIRFGEARSMSFWVRVDGHRSGGGYARVFGLRSFGSSNPGTGYVFLVNRDQWVFDVWTMESTNPWRTHRYDFEVFGAPSETGWQQVTLVSNPSGGRTQIQIFLNGEQSRAFTAQGNILMPANDVRALLGAGFNAGFRGAFGELHFWDRALSDGEVKAWFNEGAEDHGFDTLSDVTEAAPSDKMFSLPRRQCVD